MNRVRSIVSLGVSGTFAFTLIGFWSGDDKFYRELVMPTISRYVDPETAHRMAIFVARFGLLPNLQVSNEDSVLTTTFLSRQLNNPVGLAAGFDKNAEAYDNLFRLGFSSVEVGSITPLPQAGNPKPRIFRLPEDGAVINRYGFNSDGHGCVLRRLKSRDRSGHLIGVNLGKNKCSVSACADYETGVQCFSEVADYFVINVSSPNTPGLRDLQQTDSLRFLLDSVIAARNRYCPDVPVLLKISPDLSYAEKEAIAGCALEKKVSGLIVGNTTVTRSASLRSAHAHEAGGLSGEPLNRLSTDNIADMYRLTKGAVPIIGCGGVSCGQHAYDKIRAGASYLQLYTSLVIQGPPVVGKIKRELAALLRRDGFSSVSEAVGFDHPDM